MQMLTGSVSKILDESPSSEGEGETEDEDVQVGVVYERGVDELPLETVGNDRFFQLDSIEVSRQPEPQLPRDLLGSEYPLSHLKFLRLIFT